MFKSLTASYLKLYIGPMFSSKSSTLISEINRFNSITNNILVINNELDNQRYTKKENIIRTHNDKELPALMMSSLGSLVEYKIYNDANIVVIDEAQFFPDLYEFINKEVNNISVKKIFIVAGLSGDSSLNPIAKI